MEDQFVSFKNKNYKVEINTEGKKVLNLRKKRIKSIEDIRGLELIFDLDILNLECNKIEVITGLKTLDTLEFLNLSNNKIQEINGLCDLNKLKKLNLANNKIHKISGMDSLILLEELDLHNNDIYLIKGIEKLVSLENIDLSGNPVDIVANKRFGFEYTAKQLVLWAQKRAIVYNFRDKQEIEEAYLEKNLMNKLSSILNASNKVELEFMRMSLGLDKDTFSKKIFDWALRFGFKIDGKFVIIEKEEIDSFLKELDDKFDTWDKGGKKE